MIDWHIGVFCQNEQRTIGDCLARIAAAANHRDAIITVMINGSTDDSEHVARSVAPRLKTPIRIVRILHGDKSHAINTFLHDRAVRVDADLYFGVDAYVRVCPGALEAMAQALERDPRALTATGVAMTGRTEPRAHMATVATGGALRGQLYALRRSFVDRMAISQIRLPIGLYWGDGLLGAMAAFDLDPHNECWVPERLLTVPGARFAIDPLSPFRIRDVRRQLRRRARQKRGALENAAIREIVHRSGFLGLPEYADDLVPSDRKPARPTPDSLRPARVL